MLMKGKIVNRILWRYVCTRYESYLVVGGEYRVIKSGAEETKKCK